MRDDSKYNRLAEYVELIQQGETHYREKLYTESYGMVYATARSWLHDEMEAEDMTQDVMLQAFDKLSELKDTQAYGKWILRITQNHCKNYLKRRSDKRTPQPVSSMAVEEPDSFFESFESEEDVEIAFEKKEREELLSKLLEKLSPEQRMAMTLVYINEMTVREASSLLEVPEGTVKSRLLAGRKSMEELVTLQERKLGYKLYSVLPLALFRYLFSYREEILRPRPEAKMGTWAFIEKAGYGSTSLLAKKAIPSKASHSITTGVSVEEAAVAAAKSVASGGGGAALAQGATAAAAGISLFTKVVIGIVVTTAIGTSAVLLSKDRTPKKPEQVPKQVTQEEKKKEEPISLSENTEKEDVKEPEIEKEKEIAPVVNAFSAMDSYELQRIGNNVANYYKHPTLDLALEMKEGTLGGKYNYVMATDRGFQILDRYVARMELLRDSNDSYQMTFLPSEGVREWIASPGSTLITLMTQEEKIEQENAPEMHGPPESASYVDLENGMVAKVAIQRGGASDTIMFLEPVREVLQGLKYLEPNNRRSEFTLTSGSTGPQNKPDTLQIDSVEEWKELESLLELDPAVFEYVTCLPGYAYNSYYPDWIQYANKGLSSSYKYRWTSRDLNGDGVDEYLVHCVDPQAISGERTGYWAIFMQTPQGLQLSNYFPSGKAHLFYSDKGVGFAHFEGQGYGNDIGHQDIVLQWQKMPMDEYKTFEELGLYSLFNLAASPSNRGLVDIFEKPAIIPVKDSGSNELQPVIVDDALVESLWLPFADNIKGGYFIDGGLRDPWNQEIASSVPVQEGLELMNSLMGKPLSSKNWENKFSVKGMDKEAVLMKTEELLEKMPKPELLR